jgi:hypothetical protein
MTKKELLQAVKEIREICGENFDIKDCANCDFNKDHTDAFGCVFAETAPEDWEIERLERGPIA